MGELGLMGLSSHPCASVPTRHLESTGQLQVAHLELDGDFARAQREAGREQHSTLLFSDRFSALPLTPFDFFQKLPVGREGKVRDKGRGCEDKGLLNLLCGRWETQSQGLSSPCSFPGAPHQVLEDSRAAIPRNVVLQGHGVVEDFSCALSAEQMRMWVRCRSVVG